MEKDIETKHQKRSRETQRCGGQPKKKQKKTTYPDDGQGKKNISPSRKRKCSNEDIAKDRGKKTRTATEDFTHEQDPPGGSGTPSSCPGQRTSVSIKRFTFQKILGQGSFGTVLLAQDSVAHNHLAMKIIQKTEVENEENRKAVFIERRILQESAGSNFLIHGICAFQTEELLCLGMEYTCGGDLDKLLSRVHHLDIKTATFYGAEITSGLQYMHRKGFVHRDIKPENILLDEAGHVKVADFGISLENMIGDKKAIQYAGTLGYIAPEVRLGRKYNCAADWYSFGVTLFQLLTGERPSRAELIGVKDFSLNAVAKNIIEKLLNKRPVKRLGADGKIRKHPFFRNIDWAELEALQLEPPFIPDKPSEEPLPHLKLEELLRPTGSAWDLFQCYQEEFQGFSF